MKILVLSDVESQSLWDYYTEEKIKDIDLILSCGDLKAEYLSFLVTMAHCPLLYVHGNHDGRYEVKPPEGCICIEDQIYKYKGIRILGLGGSMRYKDGDHQYTESEMRGRVRRLGLKLWKNKGFDILLTHAPAFGVQDGDDLPHVGFKVFLELMEKYNPKYFIHGHMHLNYKVGNQRFLQHNNTMVVNGYQSCIIEYDLNE